jgi:hypothetical protein
MPEQGKNSLVTPEQIVRPCQYQAMPDFFITTAHVVVPVYAQPYNSAFVYLMNFFCLIDAGGFTRYIAWSRKQDMLLKLRSTVELLKLCPGSLIRVKPRVINTDFKYAIGLRRVREAPREKQPYLAACIMLYELHGNGHLHKASLSRAGKQALNETRDYFRQLHQERHQSVLDEVRERSGLSSQSSILHVVQ